MIVLSCGRESLCFCLGEHLGMSSVFLWDRFEVFVLVRLDRPFLGKIGPVDNNFISFFPFARPC